ncbi:hypothetical protein D3C87_2131710 [compost metagenome]
MLIHRVIRNQVHINQLPAVADQFGQLQGMLLAVIDILQQNILQGNSPVRLFQIVINSGH